MTVLFAVCLALSLAAIAVFGVLALRMYRADFSLQGRVREAKRAVITPFHILMAGVLVSALFMLFPVYYTQSDPTAHPALRGAQGFFLAFYSSLRLFILEGDYETVINNLTACADGLSSVYSMYATLLFVAAPFMTAGFVLSFFKDAKALLAYYIRPRADIYLMSELNERSLTLARDIMTNPSVGGKPLVVFADVLETDEDERVELIARAKQLRAICFKKDITDIGLKYRKRGITRKIYCISEQEDKNLRQALEMIEHSYSAYYGTEEERKSGKAQPDYAENARRTEFYIFANSRASEALIDSVPKGEMRVRRVYVSRNFALSLLESHSIFADAVAVPGSAGDDGTKEMNIVIVGLGSYGTELLRAVSWCGQMKGYQLNIHVFDRENNGEERVRSIAPDLIRYNRVRYAGEPYYNIRFYGGVDVYDYSFLDTLSGIRNVTTAYVMLGDDEMNLETAIAMRTQFERDRLENGDHVPPIFTVIYNSQKRKVIMNNAKEKGLGSVEYGVYLIGDLETRYSVATIEQRELEEDGFAVHIGYYSDRLRGKSEEEQAEIRASARAEYEKNEYCRRSSMAVAVHEHCRRDLGLLYGSVTTEEDNVLEHCRWSAFMRAEGYVGSVHGKNPIAKTHGDLVPYDRLTEEEKHKDLAVIEAKRGLRGKGKENHEA